MSEQQQIIEKQLPNSSKARSRFSKERLKRMHESMRRHIGPEKMPGLVTLVYHRGEIYVDAIGTFDYETQVPMQRNTIFRLASMTKPITAIATMILVEECKIRLDDPIDNWLPELKDRRVVRSITGPIEDTVPANRRITLRDLLTFRAGYGELGFKAPMSPLHIAMMEAQLPLATWPVAISSEEFIRRLGNLPLAHQPGEQWLYHMGSEILGVLISRVSGQTLSTFFREHIFEPLGMDDTDFYVPSEKLERFPTCYGINFPQTDFVVLDKAKDGQFVRPPIFEGGGGGLVSTVDDLLALGLMMLNKGTYNGERILARPTIELMTTGQISESQKTISPFFENFWDFRTWGLGVSVVTNRHNIEDNPGRFGWDGAFGTSWYVDPQEQLIGILMNQRRPDVLGLAPVVNDFWTSTYQLIDD